MNRGTSSYPHTVRCVRENCAIQKFSISQKQTGTIIGLPNSDKKSKTLSFLYPVVATRKFRGTRGATMIEGKQIILH